MFNWHNISSILATAALLLPAMEIAAGEAREESDVRFAFYSSQWGENTDDGLRIVANNQRQHAIILQSIELLPATNEREPVIIPLGLEVPAMGYADMELEYVDLLSGDDCIERTMAESWKLVEISNYTLNPSVRNLIIEDTDSFRIYQCIRSVNTTWINLATSEQSKYEEWVLFHFETRRDF